MTNIGLAYLSSEETHNDINSIYTKLNQLKNIDGFDGLSQFDFMQLKLNKGKNYGHHAIRKLIESMDVIYIFEEDIEKINENNIINIKDNKIYNKGCLIEKHIKVLDRSELESLKKNLHKVSLRDIVVFRILHDIENDFNDTKKIYYYKDPEKSLIKDGELAIKTIEKNFVNDLLREYNAHEIQHSHKTIEELYRFELDQMRKNIQSQDNMIKSFEDSIQKLKQEKSKIESDAKTLNFIIKNKYR